jgi:hypothetical protein
MKKQAKKQERSTPIVRAWEKEVRLNGAQLSALNRGATVKAALPDGTVIVIVGPEPS